MEKVMQALNAAINANPDLRFGQLIENVMRRSFSARDAFFVSNDEFADALYKYAGDGPPLPDKAVEQGTPIHEIIQAHDLFLAGDASGKRANLSGRDLRGLNLRYMNLSWANMSEADLRGVDLSDAMLHRTNFFGADLRGANLSGADLRYAIMDFANLEGTDLRLAHLGGVYMRRVDLGEAYM